jgi:hypothetical protein
VAGAPEPADHVGVAWPTPNSLWTAPPRSARHCFPRVTRAGRVQGVGAGAERRGRRPGRGDPMGHMVGGAEVVELPPARRGGWRPDSGRAPGGYRRTRRASVARTSM